MPDRSSHQDLPEEWDHGSHAAHEPFAADGPSNGYGAGTAGSHRGRTADGYGAGPAAAYGAPQTDAQGAKAESYGTANTDAPGTYGAAATGTYGAGAAGAYRTGTADPFGNADPFGPRTGEADPFGPRTGDADPFGPRTGDADPFGPRTGDPFGPAATVAFGAVTPEAETARPEAERPMTVIGDPSAGKAADAKGFLGALFDFGFTSFVTPKVIKVLYLLIVIGTVISALVFTIMVFKASVIFGLLTLVVGDPLFILIVLAIYRMILEFFVVTFRVAEDIRALRERGDLR
jgi:Domain of unknown function (DUF4282)